MATIWPVYEGREPTVGGPWARLPISKAVALFELRAADFVSDMTQTPRFGDANRDLRIVGYKHVVVEIEREEAQKANLKPGYYLSRVTPKEAFKRLVQQAIVDEIGKENVVRVEHEPTTDSQGREAIKITVVLTPGAVQRLDDGAVLDALVSLNLRLREMREDRIPIVEYATEVELSRDGATQF
jgi:hypothetical protein